MGAPNTKVDQGFKGLGRRWAAIVLGPVWTLTLLVLSAQPSAGAFDGIDPFKMVRSLQFVQDSVVLGDHSAGEMQRHLLALIDERLRASDKAVFSDKRNVDAALIYSMSGGNPETLALLMRSEGRTYFNADLAQTLTTYFTGNPEKARVKLISLLDEYKGSRIESYLTLVAANVTAPRDALGALKLFDWARLLAPGTIIEESALRRATHIASRAGLVEQAMDNAERYVRRYLHSPYASQFVDIFVYAVVEHSDEVDAQRMEYILSLMDAPRQREIYLRMARMSTIAGKEQLALLAARRAEALSGEKRDIVRDLAEFYAGVASVPTDNLSEAVEAIASVPDGRLSERDRALRDAARIIAEEVTRQPVLSQVAEPAVVLEDAPSEQTVTEMTLPENDPIKAFMAAKRSTLDDIDQLLDGNNDQ
ncbi:MAG: chemotaxis protein [Alphaproteobacteria bacterium]|nr:chemotaxis protein [Alphaproteobacteria bacterium]